MLAVGNVICNEQLFVMHNTGVWTHLSVVCTSLVCVCVCVCARACMYARVYVCVCVCVCWAGEETSSTATLWWCSQIIPQMHLTSVDRRQEPAVHHHACPCHFLHSHTSLSFIHILNGCNIHTSPSTTPPYLIHMSIIWIYVMSCVHPARCLAWQKL